MGGWRIVPNANANLNLPEMAVYAASVQCPGSGYVPGSFEMGRLADCPKAKADLNLPEMAVYADRVQCERFSFTRKAVSKIMLHGTRNF